MEELNNESRRQALAKLAKLTAYSTPAIVTLLTPQLSHAAASIPAGSPDCAGGAGAGKHLIEGANPARNRLGGQPTDTANDCGA